MSYNTFSPIIHDGLILYLDSYNTKSYDNGTTWNNLIETNSGNLVGGCTFSNNKMLFDGIDGCVNYGPNTIAGQLRNTSEFTVSVWVKKSNISSDFTIGSYDIYSVGWFLQWYPDNNIYACVRDNVSHNTTPLIWTDNWYNIVMVYDGNQLLDINKVSIYINGEIKAVTNTGTLLSSVPSDMIDLKIGSLVNYTPFFDGFLSTVTIHNRVLTNTEIIYNYNALKNRFIV